MKKVEIERIISGYLLKQYGYNGKGDDIVAAHYLHNKGVLKCVVPDPYPVSKEGLERKASLGKIGVSVVKKMPAIAKYVFVGGALTLVADYIKMHHIDWLVMNGGFVGFNIAAYELDKFKGKKTVRTFNAFSLSNFKEVGLSGFFCVKK